MPNNIQPMNPARMTHLPPGDFSMLVLRDAAASLDQARGYIERCSDAHPNDPIVLARALTIQILAETLDQYILSTGDCPMPTEQPKMPFDSHVRALNHGANRGLPLQAGEIAEYPRRSSFEALAERVLIGACVIGACGVAGILAAIAIRSLI
jgi:hypothetical protein